MCVTMCAATTTTAKAEAVHRLYRIALARREYPVLLLSVEGSQPNKLSLSLLHTDKYPLKCRQHCAILANGL